MSFIAVWASACAGCAAPKTLYRTLPLYIDLTPLLKHGIGNQCCGACYRIQRATPPRRFRALRAGSTRCDDLYPAADAATHLGRSYSCAPSALSNTPYIYVGDRSMAATYGMLSVKRIKLPKLGGLPIAIYNC